MIYTGGAGNDIITGGSGNDTFNVNLGTDTITDLSTGDDLIVSSGATATATNIAFLLQILIHSNSGTANLTARAAGGIIKVNAAGSGTYNINSGAGTDTLWGGSGNDTFTIANATEGDNDTIDGYGGTDTLQLSTGAHTFATDGNLANIEDIKVHSSGSTLDLTNQTENFNVTVGCRN